MRRLAVFDEGTESNLGGQVLNLPENGFVSTLDFVGLLCGCAEIRRTRHVKDCFEECKPWRQLTLLHQKWSHLQLIAHVKYLANEMEHIEGVLIFLISQHVIDKEADYVKSFLYNLEEGLSLLVEFEFIPCAEGIETLEACVN